jgi:superfamily II DNA/RNA helicase
MLAEPEIPKFKLDANGEPVEVASTASAFKRIDPQTILISATLSSGIKEIARRLNVDDPVVIDAAYSDSTTSRRQTTLRDATVDENENVEHEKIALPANLSHFYVSVPSKLRLIGLISFILDKFLVN